LPIVPDAALDLDAFLALPRLTSLQLSPDGSRLAATVHTVAADGKHFAGSIWELPTSGHGLARRLTRSSRGEAARGFLPDGSLLFTSSRRDLESSDEKAPEADALFVLPATGGEPRRVLAPPDGVGEVLTATGSTRVVVTAPLHPGVSGFAEDEARQAARRDAGIEARLIEHYPDRYWDHPLGPREPRLLAVDLDDPDGPPPEPRDLTPAPPWPGWLEDVSFALSDDGSHVAFGAVMRSGPGFKADLAVVDTVGGGLRVLIDGAAEHGPVAWAPDGGTIAVAWTDLAAPGAAPHVHLSLADAATGATTQVEAHLESPVHEIRWTRDGRALLVTADERGHTPVFRVELDGRVTRLTAEGAYRNLLVAPDGETVYAIRSHVTEVPVAVALSVSGADQRPAPLPGPVAPVLTGTRLEEVTARAADGAEVHSWLVLPDRASAAPLPLAVFIHGGPFASWSGWHWRWSASVLAARGWAVLLPNPRLSTGYGHEHVAAAWGDWATLPAGDILTAVDAVAGRPDVDGKRVAAMGGSYGGYMANWLSVTTGDRFAAIVTHASVWDLSAERAGSDAGLYMEREFGALLANEENWRCQSPHLHADALHIPMLVIHGSRDERVPAANGENLWMELQARGVPSRFLLFPDENHWVLKPQNARLWYQTVFAFLDEHVLGEEWCRPELL
jgi:dipeptidyl aminopeptidase/acylaminoacyl peptidase